MLRFIQRLLRRTPPRPRPRPFAVPEAAAEQTVRKVLGMLPGRARTVTSPVWDELARLGGRDLLAFDRNWRVIEWYQAGEEYGWLDLAASLADPAHKVACRFAGSCCPSGYIRQDALRALSGSVAPLAIAAAMIRSKDWVPEVRAQAESNLRDALPAATPETLFGLLELFLLLGQRQREARGAWEAVFDARLRDPAARDARWASTAHHAATVRRAAFELVLEADPDRRDEALVRAASDRALALAAWALGPGSGGASPGLVDALLDAGSRHRHPAVRAHALRLRHRRCPAVGPLRSALLDSARSVRDAAEFLLRSEFADSALPTWRQAFAAGAGDPNFLVAASALAEHAEAEDADRLAVLVTHSSPRLRSRAINALARIKSPSLANHLGEGLRDPSARVVREVVAAYRTGNVSLHPQDLARAIHAAPSTAVRRALIAGSRTLDKWDAIELLLRLALVIGPAAGPAGGPDVESQVHVWIRHANARFTPLPDPRRDRLIALLGTLGKSDPNGPWGAVRALI